MAPLVSVIMLSYNHATYLPAAMDSVLSQTLRDLELIVADDGSTDGSLEIATRRAESDPRVRVVTHPGHGNRGIGPTANLASAATSGKYLIGLPSDDILCPDAIEREVAFLEGNPDVGYVYGYAHQIDAEGRLIEVETRNGREPRRFGVDVTGGGRVVERLVQANSIAGLTALWRRECWAGVGGDHPTLVYGDWDRHVRAAAHWQVGFIPRALALYRVHGANTSVGVPRDVQVARQLEVMRVLREQAPSVGGRLAEPRVRALLELQVGYLRFAAGEAGGEADLRAAFERDPSLTGDARWLADWLWARPLDERLPSEGPDFARWFHGGVQSVLEPRVARTMRREAAAVSAEARAIRLARAGRVAGACSSALVAWACSPRRLRDPRLTGVLLDAVARTGWGGMARRLKHRVVRR